MAITIGSWFLCNGGLLLSNKYLMATGFKDQRLPLSLTCAHMLMTAFSTTLMVTLGWAPQRQLHDTRQARNVAMLASVTGASIVLGIWSLEYIALSLEQAVGATTPFFTALFALLVFNKRETTAVYLSLVVLVAGTLVGYPSRAAADPGSRAPAQPPPPLPCSMPARPTRCSRWSAS